MTAREEQVEDLLATRRRQVEQAVRVDAWLEANNNGNTHHGYGLDVKEHKRFCSCESEAIWAGARCDCGYELVRRTFWDDAEHLAGERGFDGVYQYGRSGGWLVVNPQPRMDDWWEHEQREWLESFAAFALEIEELLDDTRDAWDKGEHVSGEKLETLLSQQRAEAGAYD